MCSLTFSALITYPWPSAFGYHTSTTETPPLLLHVCVHFDHALNPVYVSHLTYALDLFDEKTDLSRASDTLVSMIHDATIKSFPTTHSLAHTPLGTMLQNPYYDDKCREMRSHLPHERALGHMTTQEAQQISRRLTRRKRRAFLARRLEEAI